MAKLYYKYGSMGSSKTANALMTKFNYEEKGKRVLLLKPSIDNRDGEDIIKSRIGLEAKAECIDAKTDIKKFISDIQNTVETFRASVPSNLFTKVVYTDTRRKLLQLKDFVSY